MALNIFRKDGKDDAPGPPAEPAGGGLFAKLKSGLRKTHDKVAGGLRAVLTVGRKLDDELLSQLEEQLYLADMGPRTAIRLCEGLREAYKSGQIQKPDQVLPYLKEQIKSDLRQWDTALNLPSGGVGVLLFAGVNGCGKTTSIGKLAHRFRGEGSS